MRRTLIAADAARVAGSVPRWIVIACVAATIGAPTADAQSLAARGFFDIGAVKLTAATSFEAIVGTSTGTVFGGGGELVLPAGIFATVRASQFKKAGERVFVFEGETFPLGIDTTIRMRPFEVSGGYRFGGPNRRTAAPSRSLAPSRIVPYVGGGIGWHRYEETSEFADDEENVDETFRGYHLLGGAEVRVTRWFGVGGEFQWTTVPDALGQDPNGVSAAFEESNLGGAAFRVRIVIGG
jgi:opacity protein-like surface antigen